MRTLKFEAPVIVRSDQAEGQLSIESVEACTDFLLKNWSGKRGDKHRAAIQACADATEGKKPVASARRAFLAAARDAGVLVR